MTLRSAHLSVVAAAALLLSALPSAALAASSAPGPAAATVSTSRTASTLADALKRFRAVAPADLAQRAERILLDAGVNPLDLPVIDPDDYQCGPTEFDAWEAENLDFTEKEGAFIEANMAPMFPVLEAVLLGDVEGTNSYGATGAYTKQVTQAWKKLRVFWDEDSTEVELVPMHGRVLADADRLGRLLVEMEIPQPDAREMAELMATVFDTAPFDHGNHPFFSLNAFAMTGDMMGLPDTPDKIVMGDGILDVYGVLGMGAVAPQVILAHENVHHLQLDLGYYDDGIGTSPEATRRTELMADAGAAYSVSHPRGLSMQWNRIRHVLPVFYSIGDCGFDSSGHHGTPNQRLAAGRFGYDMQEQARPRGHVLPGATFLARVDAHLPVLTAPDAR